MKKYISKMTLLLVVFLVSTGCATKKYAFHSVYQADGCSFTRQKISESLMKNGFLRSSEAQSMYDIFKKPKIKEKSFLSGDPYEDNSGEFAVASCQNFIVSEEWKSCLNEKDCTKSDQIELKKILESIGCKVQVKSTHAVTWKLEDRQDWNQNTCVEIIKQLPL